MTLEQGVWKAVKGVQRGKVVAVGEQNILEEKD